MSYQRIARRARLLLLGTTMSLVTLSSSLGTVLAAPVFYCQAAGEYTGGWWGYNNGVPQATLNDIQSTGCAITSSAMVLWPSQATIYDERAGKTQASYADPYVVYRANNNSTYAYWDNIRKAFGWSSVNSRGISGTEQQKANLIASELDQGLFPIGHIPGHFIVFLSHGVLPAGLNGAGAGGGGVAHEGPALDQVRPGDIQPLTNAEINKQPQPIQGGPDQGGMVQAASVYDTLFNIHDSGTRYGQNIPFNQNIKGATFSSVDQLTL